MLFIIMVRLVQCKLPADSSFSNTYFLWNGALGSVGSFPAREEGIAFGTQANLLFPGLTDSLPCQALWGGETTPVLVRMWFLLIHVVLGFPASGTVPAAPAGNGGGQEQCVATWLCSFLPWVLPFLQADGHCGEVSQRRALACAPPCRDCSAASLGYLRGVGCCSWCRKL